MNMNSNITGQDSSKPAEFVNSTYEALKYNPQSAQQTLQKGANAGLAKLGAMAAVRYQQQAQDVQKVEQAQQAGQQSQPTVLQQLQMIAAQQGGIMGQLPSNIAMAQQPEQGPQVGGGLGTLPVDPRTLPQEMAGGGLVALAEGGFLDYGYDGGEGYAEGGEVRGFFGGGDTGLYDPTEKPFDYAKNAITRASDLIIPGYEDYRRKREAEYDEDAGDEYYDTTEASPEEKEIRRLMGLPEAYAEAMKAGEPMPETKTLKHEAGGRNGEVPAGQESIRNPKPQVSKEATKVDKQFKSGQRDDNHLVSDAQTPAASGSEPVPAEEERRALMDRARQETQEEFALKERADKNMARAETIAQSGGLPAIQGQRAAASDTGSSFEENARRMNELYGATPQMSPEERAWRKEQIESSRADKWLQTLMAMAGGTFASGETTGPAAIGKGALLGLSTYRQGAQAEAEAELGLIQADAAYKAAEAAQRKEAVKDVSSIMQNTANLGSASDIAGLKSRSAATVEEFKAANKARENELNREAAFERAMLNANAIQGKDAVATSKLVEDMVKMAVEEARSTNPAIKQNDIDQIRSKIYAQFNMTPPGLGGGQGLGGGMGMGNRPIVRRDRIIPAAQQ
jgi:hypothetical protein